MNNDPAASEIVVPSAGRSSNVSADQSLIIGNDFNDFLNRKHLFIVRKKRQRHRYYS